MGCWKGTCGLGGLPIKEGTRVKAVIIMMAKEPASASGFSYMCEIASPISFVFSGEYNGYGGITLDSEDALEVKLFREMLLFREGAGELTIKPDCLDKVPDVDLANISMEEFINEYIEREKVFLRHHGEREIGLMFFSEDLYEAPAEKEVGKERAEGLEELIKINIENEPSTFGFENDSNNVFRQLTGTEVADYPTFCLYIRLMRKNHIGNADIREMILTQLKLVDLMISQRISWGPLGGKGSQSFSLNNGYKYAMSLMSQVLSHVEVGECFCTKDSDEEFEVMKVEDEVITLESNSETKVLTVKEFFESFLHEW